MRHAGGIAERLRHVAHGCGGNKRLCEIAKINIGTLNNYLAGREPRISVLVAVSRAANVSLDWIATGEGPMRPGANPTVSPAPPAVAAPTTPAAKSADAEPDQVAKRVRALANIMAWCADGRDTPALLRSLHEISSEIATKMKAAS